MKKNKTIAIIFSVATLFVAIMGLIGYLPGMGLTGSLGKDYIPMAFSTAISFIFCATTILYLNAEKKTRFLSAFFIVLAGLVSLFGLLDFIGFVVGKDLNFEESIVNIGQTVNGVPVGLMSPANGALFFLAGGVSVIYLAALLSNKKFRISAFLFGFGGLLVLFASIVFTLAYLFGKPLMYDAGYRGAVIPMAFTTALGFLTMSVAMITFQAHIYPLRLIEGQKTRSMLFRYILPLTFFSVILGIITGTIFLEFSEINPAILAIILIILASFLSIAVATLITRYMGHSIEGQTEAINHAWQALRESEEKYRNLFETMEQGVVYQNTQGEIFSANTAAERILGLSFEQMKGRKSLDPRWKAVDKNNRELAGEEHPAMIALRTRKPVLNFLQGIFNPKLENYVWILVNSVPQFKTGSDQPYQVFSTFLDITERRNAELELENLKKDLENQVLEKTKQLQERITELEQFYEATINREFRINELQKQIKELEAQLNKQKSE
ncbi:MAG: PAS domain S-box protein [Prolixibacteraceae bacterium]|nr:PAS domain S-box protein [Prolixibacteraceae bacterium]